MFLRWSDVALVFSKDRRHVWWKIDICFTIHWAARLIRTIRIIAGAIRLSQNTDRSTGSKNQTLRKCLWLVTKIHQSNQDITVRRIDKHFCQCHSTITQGNVSRFNHSRREMRIAKYTSRDDHLTPRRHNYCLCHWYTVTCRHVRYGTTCMHSTTHP